jgi:hypothetical protein
MASTTTERNALQESVFAAMAAKILYAAAELELPDLLAAGPRTSRELADRTDAHGPSLRRLLRALAGLGAVRQLDPDRFELSALGATLRAEAPDSIHAVLRMLCGPENWRSWGELVAGVHTGETPWELAHGVSWIAYYEQHPKEAASFNRAMAEHTRAAAPGILAAADLARFDAAGLELATVTEPIPPFDYRVLEARARAPEGRQRAHTPHSRAWRTRCAQAGSTSAHDRRRSRRAGRDRRRSSPAQHTTTTTGGE